MNYTFKPYKTITQDGIAFHFTKSAYNEMVKEIEGFDLNIESIESYDLLIWCNSFDVL